MRNFKKDEIWEDLFISKKVNKLEKDIGDTTNTLDHIAPSETIHKNSNTVINYWETTAHVKEPDHVVSMADASTNKKQSLISKLFVSLSRNENSIISPYGIIAVLAMAAEGSNPLALNKILSALNFDSIEQLRDYISLFKSNFEVFESKNSILLFGDDLKLLEDFKQTIINHYTAEIDENGSSNKSCVTIKNSSNFKAEWLYETKKDASHEKCFKNFDGSVCHPAFLSCKQVFSLYTNSHFDPTIKAIAIPYKFSNITTPYELVLIDSDKDIDEKDLKKILSNMEKEEVEVIFPEFSIKNEINLKPIMNELDLAILFDEHSEVFNRIATKPLYASDFVQISEIQVDEKGTIAKAETALSLGTKSMQNDCIFFYKPFSYIIRNAENDQILFIGKVNKLADCERQISKCNKLIGDGFDAFFNHRRQK